MELASNTLRSVEALLSTIDADERYRAREERRSANVHTNYLKMIATARAALARHGAGQEGKNL